MKNEVLLKAITEIDDELVLSAHRSAFPKRNVIKYFGACAAACLIFVCGIIFLSHSNSDPKILFNGAVVSSQPITVISNDTRQAEDQSIIALPLEIVSKGDLTVESVGGTIEMYSSKTNEQLCVGQFCKAKGSVAVEWTIENPDHSQTYKIQVNDQEITLILKYEQTTNEWILIKSED
ncbi:MAG: hypothetical protein J1E05_01700 [Eubacterium sp.]|nr:hypothetical protein [Eubacterium sp.]